MNATATDSALVLIDPGIDGSPRTCIKVLCVHIPVTWFKQATMQATKPVRLVSHCFKHRDNPEVF